MKALISVTLLFLGAPALAANILSSFDGDSDGWTSVNATVFEWRNTDGNPPGQLYIDNNESGLAYIFAPARFRGDLTAYIGGTIAFDGKLLGTGGSFYNNTNFDYGSIRISNGATTVTLDLAPGGAVPGTSAWQNFSAPLTAAAWGRTDQQFADLLANVTELRIGVEGLFGNEIQGIDNVQISAVPGPPAAVLLLTGVFGLAWRRVRSRSAWR